MSKAVLQALTSLSATLPTGSRVPWLMTKLSRVPNSSNVYSMTFAGSERSLISPTNVRTCFGDSALSSSKGPSLRATKTTFCALLMRYCAMALPIPRESFNQLCDRARFRQLPLEAPVITTVLAIYSRIAYVQSACNIYGPART